MNFVKAKLACFGFVYYICNINNNKHKDMTTLTITVPTEKAGEVAFFTIGFDKKNFQNVQEHIDMLVKPTDVALCEEMGVWEVL